MNNQLPTPTIIDAAHPANALNLGLLWRYRELFQFLVWQSFIVTYKQTLIGVGWVLIQPLIQIGIFTFIFGIVARIQLGDNTPYPVFLVSGLILWRYFSLSLTEMNHCLVSNANLISKVHFPILLLPLRPLILQLIEMGIWFVLLLALMLFYGLSPFSWRVLFVPILILMTALLALSLGVWFGAWNARYRDVGQIVPLMLQVLMYVSPVFYDPSTLSPVLRDILAFNPLYHLLVSLRWCLGLAAPTPQVPLMLLGTVACGFLLIWGIHHFNRMGRTINDYL
jgi:lipopolysaccharide transport system permease protein